MTDKDIKEMLNLLGYGETPPERLMQLIALFRRRKSVFSPALIDCGEVAFCTIIYDLFSKRKDKKEDSANG